MFERLSAEEQQYWGSKLVKHNYDGMLDGQIRKTLQQVVERLKGDTKQGFIAMLKKEGIGLGD